MGVDDRRNFSQNGSQIPPHAIHLLWEKIDRVQGGRPGSRCRSSWQPSVTTGNLIIISKSDIGVFAHLLSHYKRWGAPALDGHSSWRLDAEAKKMKVKLMTGKDQILTPPPKARRDVFPAEVKEMARDHWMDTTIPEPSVNRRMKRKQRQPPLRILM